MKLVLKNTSLDFKYVKLVRETLQKDVVSNTSVGIFTNMGILNVPIPAGTTCKITVSLSSYVGSPRVILIEKNLITNQIVSHNNTVEPFVVTYTTVGEVSYISIQLITAESAEYTATVTIEYDEEQE